MLRRVAHTLSSVTSLKIKESINTAALGWRWLQTSGYHHDTVVVGDNNATQQRWVDPMVGKLPGVQQQPQYKPGHDQAVVHISSTKNNTIVCLTDVTGSVKTRVTCGSLGMKGARKKGAHAAADAGQKLADKAHDLGYK